MFFIKLDSRRKMHQRKQSKTQCWPARNCIIKHNFCRVTARSWIPITSNTSWNPFYARHLPICRHFRKEKRHPFVVTIASSICAEVPLARSKYWINVSLAFNVCGPKLKPGLVLSVNLRPASRDSILGLTSESSQFQRPTFYYKPRETASSACLVLPRLNSQMQTP